MSLYLFRLEFPWIPDIREHPQIIFVCIRKKKVWIFEYIQVNIWSFLSNILANTAKILDMKTTNTKCREELPRALKEGIKKTKIKNFLFGFRVELWWWLSSWQGKLVKHSAIELYSMISKVQNVRRCNGGTHRSFIRIDMKESINACTI